MKKYFKYYLIAWAICFLLIYMFSFIWTNAYSTYSYSSKEFLIGYITTAVSLVLQMVIMCIALNQETKQKVLYSFSIYWISYSNLFLTTVLGIVYVNVIKFPSWLIVALNVMFVLMGVFNIIKFKKATD